MSYYCVTVVTVMYDITQTPNSRSKDKKINGNESK